MGSIKQQATTTGGLRAYQQLVVGRPGALSLLKYELAQWVSIIPGASGIVARKLSLGLLLGTPLKKAVVGRAVSIRHPGGLRVGRGTVIDELCSIDASGDLEHSVVLGDQTMLARNCKLSAKGGSIKIGNQCGLGANTTVHAPVGARIEIGESTMIGPACFIGGSNYITDDLRKPIGDQGYQPHRGIEIGSGAWLGARVTVLDGVSIGDGAVIAAGAVVTSDVPALSIARGIPARVVGVRGKGQATPESADSIQISKRA